MSFEELLLSCHGLVPVPLQAPSNALLDENQSHLAKAAPDVPKQGRLRWDGVILELEVPG